MPSLLVTIVTAVAAFAGTMVDNFVAFAAQLAVTAPARHRRAIVGQATGIAALVLIALVVGDVLSGVPRSATALFALAPWWLAAHAWRHRVDPPHRAPARGGVATFAVTIALGGDNLGVWIPLLRLDGTVRDLVAVAVFALCEALFLAVVSAIARHPRVITLGARWASLALPIVYVALGVLIAVEALA